MRALFFASNKKLLIPLNKVSFSVMLFFLIDITLYSQYLNPDNFSSLGTFNPATNVTVNMSTRSMSGGVTATGVISGSILVFTFDSFNLPAGISISFTNVTDNDDKIAFLSKGNMTISGNIYANASGSTPGPGGRRGGIGNPDISNSPEVGFGAGGGQINFDGSNDDGAGGGGFGGAGGKHGYNAPGGTAYGDLAVALDGGSGGARSMYDPPGGFGGGGGGALELGALGTLTLNNGCNVEAKGAAGVNARLTMCGEDGDGGGSGGGILIHGNIVTVNSGANINASGGNGGNGDDTDIGGGVLDCTASDGIAAGDGGSGGGGGGGRIRVAYNTSGTNNGNLIVAGGSIDAAENYPGTAGSVGVTQFLQDSNVPIPGPEISIEGNSTVIGDGDSSPSADDHTNFGSTAVVGGTVVRTFTIKNTGDAALTLSGSSPYVAIGGDAADDYSVTSAPGNSIAASNSTTFNITFNPSASGARDATLSIGNNDSNENPYNFSITGTGLAPEINVQGGGNSIADGDVVPSTTDDTDFGNQDVASGTISKTFTIQNTGSSTLTLGANAVSLSGGQSGDFSVTTQPATTVAASDSTTFTVAFDPSAGGSRSTTININNDDSNENPYDFTIKGTGIYIAPTTQATDVTFSNVGTATMTIGWTNGNGSARTVFLYVGSSGSASPAANTTYTANTTYGVGTQIDATGWYCVYNGAGTSVNVTGLIPGATYRAMVCEYNGTAGYEAYNTGTAAGNPANQSMYEIIINEVDADTPGADDMEFIELYDGGVGNVKLDGLVIVFFNGADNKSVGSSYDLDTKTTDANGYFVLGNSAVSGVDKTFANGALQDGEDAVALYVNDSANFPDDTPLTTTNLVDAIVYETGADADAGLLSLLTGGSQVDENGRGNAANHSNQRLPNGSGELRNTTSYDQQPPTPKAANYAYPAIISATYNYSTNILAVTSEYLVGNTGDNNDVDVSLLTITGEGGSSYTLSSSSDVEISSASLFNVTLTGVDIIKVEALLNKDGTQAADGSTTYNLAAAEDWLTGAPSANNIADATNGITVSNYAVPVITSSTYDYSTGQLVATGTNFVLYSGADNDVDASLFTFTGQVGDTYQLTNTSDVDVTSATQFTLTLSTTDKANVDELLNKNGTSANSGTTYNLAAADNWMTGSPSGNNIADATTGITVSNVPPPSITSATYNFTTNVLTVTGLGFVPNTGATNDVDVSQLIIAGQGGSYQLQTGTNVEITSTTEFSVTLSGDDLINVERLLNKDGTSSAGSTTYNLGAAEDWMLGYDLATVIADLNGNGITVSNYANPAITSATYDYNTNVLVVTGTNFVATSGATNDVDISLLTFTGEAGAAYTITSTNDVELTSDTQFSLILSAMDLPNTEALLNKTGTQAADGVTTFNLSAADNWMPGAYSTYNIADVTNTITVSNYANPAITSATYDYGTNVLVITGTNFVTKSGATNDIDISLFTFTGQGGSTYPLANTGYVEISSATQFSVTLTGNDLINVEALLNKDGLSSAGGTTYNIAAADDWMAGSPGINNIADATSGITVSNFANPVITSSTYDANTGILVATGTNFVLNSGGSNDVDASLFTFTGQAGGIYTLTNTGDVEITSDTEFSLTLSSDDKLQVAALLNKNGTTALNGTTYNLAAADNWMPGSPSGNNIADATTPITVSNTPVPTITSATYNYNTNVLTVTGTGFVPNSGATNDIDVSQLIFTGEGGSTYQLATVTNVEITSQSAFSVTLSGTDLTNTEALLNKTGTQAADGVTTYNLGAAEDWLLGYDAATIIADLNGNAITVSNFANPAITSATYDVSTGVLVVTGTNFVNKSGVLNDVDASLITIKGAEDATYQLNDTPDVEIASSTSFTLILSATDKMYVHGLLNKNGLQSSDATVYNLAAADNWMQGSPSVNDISDLTGNAITVSNVQTPTITSATYDSDSGIFVVTGTSLFKKPGGTNDIDVSKFTVTGEGGNYTISDAITDVEITSATEYTFTVTGSDKTQIDSRLDLFGTQSSGGTTYNLAAAEDWLQAADASANIADLAGNGITVVVTPKITSVTYNAATGVIVVTGTNIQANGGGADIDASKFIITGEGGDTYTLTNTSDVERTSATQFTLTLHATDWNAIAQIINKNGTSSTSGTTYNLAAADDWCTNVTAGNTADLTGNGITASNVPAPAITSATYNANTGVFVVTGTRLVKKSGALNDIDISKLTITGEGGDTYNIANTANVEITSGISFTINLNAADKAAVNMIINKNGTSSTSGTTYNLAAAEDWAVGADAEVNVVDATGNGIIAGSIPVPVITSASYHWSDGILTATGTGFTKKAGVTNDIDASKFTFRGEGGATYTLVGSADVEITSGTEFAITLDATDKAAVNLLINNPGTQSNDNTVYNLAAAEDWAVGADPAVNVVDATTPITAGNFNNPPTGADDIVTTNEDTPHTFLVSDFTFNDADNDNFAGIRIESLETAGELKYNGTDVVIGTECSDVSLLIFSSPPQENGSPFATFTFKVKDDRGAYSAAIYTMTINVTDVVDNPVVVVNTGGIVPEGGAFTFTDGMLRSNDSDSPSYNLTYLLTYGPNYGEILTSRALMKREGVTVISFTQNDIANGKVSYHHFGGEILSDTIKFIVKDGEGGESPETEFIISVNSINDPPVFTGQLQFIMKEDEELIISLSDLLSYVSDPDTPDSLLSVVVASGCANMQIEKMPDCYHVNCSSNWHGTGECSITVSDELTTIDTLITIIVQSVNDLPVLSGIPSSVEFNQASSITIDLSGTATDLETPDSLLAFSLSCDSDSIITSYDNKSMILKLSAASGYYGESILTITVTDSDGGSTSELINVTVIKIVTGIERLEGIPTDYVLYQNYPNPFNPSTTIRYGIPSRADNLSAANVMLRVYDILGNQVATLVNEQQSPGYYEYHWKAGNLSSGIYFYLLRAGSFTQSRKMLLIR